MTTVAQNHDFVHQPLSCHSTALQKNRTTDKHTRFWPSHLLGLWTGIYILMALLVVQRDTIFPLSGEFTNCKYTCMLYQHVWFKFRFVIIHIISGFGVTVSFNYFANVQGVPSLQVQARIVEEGLYTNTSVRQSLILNPLGTHCCLHPSSASHHILLFTDQQITTDKTTNWR